MNCAKKILKKTMAITAASSLIVAGGNTVLAANSYQEAEKTAYGNFVSNISSLWDQYLANYQKAQEGSKATITLNVEDTGRALLGGMTGGMDFSWLQSISLDTDVSLQKGLEALKAAVLLNDTKLGDLNVLMDFSELAEYIQIPEISEGYLQAPLQTSESSISDDAVKLYFNILSDLSSVLPDKDVLSTLLNRYGDLVISNMEDNTTAVGESSVTVEDITETCNMYEGTISEADALKMAEQVLETSRDDKEIKELFDTWTESGAVEKDQYEQFQTTVDDLLEEVKSEEASDDSFMIYSKILVNKDDKVMGRELGTIDGDKRSRIIDWKAPSDGDSSALSLSINADTSQILVLGSGATSDGLLTGDYSVEMDSTKLDVHVDGLETKPEKPGYYNGKFTFTVPTDTSESTESNPLAGFAAELALISDAEAETSQIDLTLSTSGAPLATLSIAGGYGEGAEVADTKTLTPVYSVDDESAVTEYMKTINWDTLAENATAAGVPEELVSQIKALLDGAVENVINPQTSEEGTEDTIEDTASETADAAA